jgi:hypothetical protein
MVSLMAHNLPTDADIVSQAMHRITHLENFQISNIARSKKFKCRFVGVMVV